MCPWVQGCVSMGGEGMFLALYSSVHTSASDVDESASDHVTSDEDSSDDGQSDDNETDMGGKAVARATLHVGGGFRWDVNTAECPEGGVAEKPASSDSEADEVDNVEVGTIWSNFHLCDLITWLFV